MSNIRTGNLIRNFLIVQTQLYTHLLHLIHLFYISTCNNSPVHHLHRIFYHKPKSFRLKTSWHRNISRTLITKLIISPGYHFVTTEYNLSALSKLRISNDPENKRQSSGKTGTMSYEENCQRKVFQPSWAKLRISMYFDNCSLRLNPFHCF